MLSCRHLFLVRDVGALGEAAAERNVLARSFVERDHEIVRGDLRGCDDAVVQGFQQGQSLRLRPACDKRDLQQDQVVRIRESEERPRVAELRWRQDMDLCDRHGLHPPAYTWAMPPSTSCSIPVT